YPSVFFTTSATTEIYTLSLHDALPIFETETKEQVIEAVEAKADVIMFDNCSPKQVKELVSYVPDLVVTEISGGITLGNLAKYRNLGADYISLGYITHSVKALDISLTVCEEEKK